MSVIVQDAVRLADQMAAALMSSGYKADFSPASLWQVDLFFEEQSRKGRPRRRGLLAKDLDARLFSLGAYTGEVIRRAAGGEWSGDDEDPNAHLNIAVALPDGRVAHPVQLVARRLANGADDGASARCGARPSVRSTATAACSCSCSSTSSCSS
jgi:hypothetical protein